MKLELKFFKISKAEFEPIKEDFGIDERYTIPGKLKMEKVYESIENVFGKKSEENTELFYLFL